jgi:hypothetical protein
MRVAVDKDTAWDYVNQPPLNHKMLLLCKDNVAVIGVWRGEPLGQNKTFKAWRGLPDRDRDLEIKMGYV